MTVIQIKTARQAINNPLRYRSQSFIAKFLSRLGQILGRQALEICLIPLKLSCSLGMNDVYSK